MLNLEEVVDLLRIVDNVRAFSKLIGADVHDLDVMREVLVYVIRGDPYELKEDKEELFTTNNKADKIIKLIEEKADIGKISDFSKGYITALVLNKDFSDPDAISASALVEAFIMLSMLKEIEN
jgi:hypothetical protein